MSLNHQIIYRKHTKLINDEWRYVIYHPTLSIYGAGVLEEDYVEIHDDILGKFYDIFCWINMYNPSMKNYDKGFNTWGITVIKGDNLKKLNSILGALIKVFENAPKNVTFLGYFCFDEPYPDDTPRGHYEKVKIKKEKLIETFVKFQSITIKAIDTKGYILHLGI